MQHVIEKGSVGLGVSESGFMRNGSAPKRGCILSDCGTYRYRLWRMWDVSSPTLAFVMLNPSTADHLKEAPTITRCMSRALAGKFGRIEVVNLFALRTRKPDRLLTHSNPLGVREVADYVLREVVECTAAVICAWGAHPAAHKQAQAVMEIARDEVTQRKLVSSWTEQRW